MLTNRVTVVSKQSSSALEADSWIEPNGKFDDTSILQAVLRQQSKHEQRIESLLKNSERQLQSELRSFLNSLAHPARNGGLEVKLEPHTSVSSVDDPPVEEVPEEESTKDSKSSNDEPSSKVFRKSKSKAAPEKPSSKGALLSKFAKVTSKIKRAQTAVGAFRSNAGQDDDVPLKKSAAWSRINTAKQQLQKDLMAGSQSHAAEDGEDRGGCRSKAERIVAHSFFESLSCGLIMMNSLLIGAEIEWEMQNPGLGISITFRVLNLMFSVLFTVELGMRILAQGRAFCEPRREGFSWNVFDSLLIFASWLEEIIALIGITLNIGVMRMFRTLRLARSLRIIRVVKAFRNLRVMMRGILNSLGSLCWAGGLLVAIMYVVTICLLQIVSVENQSQKLGNQPAVLSEDEFSLLMEFFGSLFQCIYTLYLSIMGGIDWNDAASPIMALSPAAGCLFIVYIAFSMLCVLNIVTGVFVENANRLSTQDEEMVLMEQLDSRRQWLDEVETLFREGDTDNSGQLDAEEFAQHFQDIRVQARFEKLGLEVSSEHGMALFKLLDFDGDGKIDIDEFTAALLTMNGLAKSIDVAKVNQDTRQIRKAVSQLTSTVARIDAQLKHQAWKVRDADEEV